MERNARIATGESVAFEYELAGLGSRFIAVLIDLAIQIGIVIAIVLVFALLSSLAHGSPTIGKIPIGKLAKAVEIGLFAIAIFMIFFGYFIVFEWRFGRTPGKAALGLRVVRDGGFPLDFTASVVRNVVRMLEFGFGFYIVSAISTLLSPFNRRLGDYAAGTLVVRSNRFERHAIPTYRDAPDAELVALLTPAERELVRRYVARRETLVKESRAAIAARIATPIRPKLMASFAHLGDDDLLVHLASTAL
jgi:uncharacterized RDD family membrane protein YckC